MTLKKWLTGSVWVASLLLATTASAATFKVAIGDAAGGTQYELGKVFAEQLKEKVVVV